MKLHGYFRSSSSYRCRIALNLKNIEAEQHYVHLLKDGGQQKSDAYLAMNPQAIVPALETDSGDVLTQSMAILEWIEETVPQPPLLPKDAVARAHVRAFCCAIACEIHPLQNLRVLQYLKGPLKAEQADVDAWLTRWLGDGLLACEKLLEAEIARNGKTDFCFGDAPGLADICLVPQVFSAERFKISLDAMPNVKRIHDNCAALDTFADAHPVKQADAE